MPASLVCLCHSARLGVGLGIPHESGSSAGQVTPPATAGTTPRRDDSGGVRFLSVALMDASIVRCEGLTKGYGRTMPWRI